MLPVSFQKHQRRVTPYSPKPYNFLIGTNSISLQAASKAAIQKGYYPIIINTTLEGEAETQATIFVDTCLSYKGQKPACLLMGGETTVTIRGNGLGGRNQHFALAALCELIKRDINPDQFPVILSGGTDGTDGPTDAAGAIIDVRAIEYPKSYRG